jgi:capsular exopolysaccharide synthesis family protein
MENISPTPTADTTLHFLDYWRIIRIRKTVILAVFLLVVLTTTVVTFWLPKYYSSTVRIAVEKDMPDIPGLFDFRQTANPFDPYFIATEFEKIQSKSVLYQVITNLDLGRKWGVKYNNGIKLETPQAYQMLRRLIDVRQFRNTSLIEIRVLSSGQPKPASQEAADIANEIARCYKANRLNLRSEAATQGILKLQEQLAKQKLEVTNAIAEVSRLREKYNISEAIAEGGPMTTLEPETVRRLEGERISAVAAYTQIQTLFTNLLAMSRAELRTALPTAWPDSLLTELLLRYAHAEQELTTLKKDYSDEHPSLDRVKQLMKTIDGQIENKVSAILVGLKAKADSLKGEVDARTQQLDEAKKKDLEKAQLYGPYISAKKNLDLQRSILQTMEMRIIQETVDKAIPKTTFVEELDRAEPSERPVRPNIALNIILGIIVGLVVGLGLAFFIEYLDTSVKTIDDVERSLQSPVLGVIPQNVGNVLNEGPESPHAEAYRVLRTNLMFARKDENLNTLTILSGGAGEGKSTTVFNLATVFAQCGQRVLMVDSDLRRPSLHKFLRVSNSIGLTNFLLKQKELEEVIQTTSLPALDFLPSGKLPSSSLGVLNSLRMKEFIAEVKRRYDMVFFDSPPIMGVSDASILASEVDMSVLVVQYRKYPQLMTVRAKQMVEKVGGRLMGVVLNNINISQDSYYYYYSGYYYDYYSYGYGYGRRKRDEYTSSEAIIEDKKPDGEQAKVEVKQKY